MKFKNYKKLSFVFIFIATLTACEDYFGDDINSNPNTPLVVPVTARIAHVQLTIVDATGGMWSLFNNMFTQQVEGVERQWDAFNNYNIQPVRFNGAWQDIYENSLVELKEIEAQSIEDGNNHFVAISKVLEAYTVMMATDVWGDIPFTEIALGGENIAPAFDDQATVIYPAIKSLLEEALALFNGPSGSVIPSSSNDLFYAGDVDKWKLAIHAILARYYLHLGDNANALVQAKLSFSSRADNMGFEYPGSPNAAQWYGFNVGREGDMEFHPTMRSIMEGLNDTDRLTIFDKTFNSDHPYLVDNYRQDLITYREIQFIIAETSSDDTEKRTAYTNAIMASFTEVGFDAGAGTEYSTYIANTDVLPLAGAPSLVQVMTQKYIGMFVQPEVFSDWRRTGIPTLTAVTGSDGIPRSWDLGENEYLFNPNAPARDAKALWKRVDWDN